jgi:hypothetical protein
VSGETRGAVSGWTVDTLHEHHQQQLADLRYQLDERYETQTTALTAAFAAAERAVQTALLAAEKAVGKAELAADKRFDLMNEFRGQLSDQAATFMTRDESIARHDRTAEQLAELVVRTERDRTLMRERLEGDIRTLTSRHEADIAAVNSRLDLTQGKSSGLDKAWAFVVAAVVVVGGVIAAAVALNN